MGPCFIFTNRGGGGGEVRKLGESLVKFEQVGVTLNLNAAKSSIIYYSLLYK